MAKSGLPVSNLMAAIRAGKLDAVIKALADGEPVDEADVHGHPGLPLRTACFEGDLAIINELIRHGADVNASGSDGAGMPLRLAVRARNRAVVDLLLEKGASVPPGTNLDFSAAPVRAAPPPPTPVAAPVARTIEPPAGPLIEEILMEPCHGVDTGILDIDLAHDVEEPPPRPQQATDNADDRYGDIWKYSR